MSVRNELDQS